MLSRIALTMLLYSTLVAATSAAGPTVVGTVTKIEPARVEIRTDDGQTTSVTLTDTTKYLKWNMAKPLQQDPRTDVRFVTVGKRVRIEVVRDDPTTARVVWIVTR